MLPADSHVHSQWSWDAISGSMEAACAEAVRLGVPAVSFTEHADFTRWSIPPDGIAGMIPEYRRHVNADGIFVPPPMNVTGYAECIERCRARYPQVKIRSGAELGEPHWHKTEVAALLRAYDFNRVIASVHSIREEGSNLVVDRAFVDHDPHQVVRQYLKEVLDLARSDADFSVLAHVDYPLRAWPESANPVTLNTFEDEFRAVLSALAESDRALELNTRLRPATTFLDWWREAGGKALSFGSDAHTPDLVAHDFKLAGEVANACGFRSIGQDLWTR